MRERAATEEGGVRERHDERSISEGEEALDEERASADWSFVTVCSSCST